MIKVEQQKKERRNASSAARSNKWVGASPDTQTRAQLEQTAAAAQNSGGWLIRPDYIALPVQLDSIQRCGVVVDVGMARKRNISSPVGDFDFVKRSSCASNLPKSDVCKPFAFFSSHIL